MTRRKGGIDRSFFDDMLGQVEEASSSPQNAEVPLDQIMPRTDQFRRTFDQDKIETLTASISELGLLEPIVVREKEGGFEIVAGERRYRALHQLGWERAPVRIASFTDAQAELAGAVENLNREDLSPLEEVDAVLSVLQHALDLPQEQVVELVTRVRGLELENKDLSEDDVSLVVSLFKRLGYTSLNSFYANRLSLLRYPDDLLHAMRVKGLAYTKARVLARVKDDGLRQALANVTVQEDLSVEEVERRVRDQMEPIRSAPSLYEDFGRVKRLITKRRVERLNAAKQKRLRQLVKEIEKLVAD